MDYITGFLCSSTKNRKKKKNMFYFITLTVSFLPPFNLLYMHLNIHICFVVKIITERNLLKFHFWKKTGTKTFFLAIAVSDLQQWILLFLYLRNLQRKIIKHTCVSSLKKDMNNIWLSHLNIYTMRLWKRLVLLYRTV